MAELSGTQELKGTTVLRRRAFSTSSGTQEYTSSLRLGEDQETAPLTEMFKFSEQAWLVGHLQLQQLQRRRLQQTKEK